MDCDFHAHAAQAPPLCNTCSRQQLLAAAKGGSLLWALSHSAEETCSQQQPASTAVRLASVLIGVIAPCTKATRIARCLKGSGIMQVELKTLTATWQSFRHHS